MLGLITLSLSSSIYILWFVPQLLLNFKRKNIAGLSFGMHTSLLIGYYADLIYGFGLQMQWQYKMVTITGLLSLSIQHWQFGYYGLKHTLSKLRYYIATAVFFVGMVSAVYIIAHSQNTHALYNFAGIVSASCFLIYMVPQILHNHAKKSTDGLSTWFILLSILLDLCDLTSACFFHWSWPSLFSPVAALFGKAIILLQIYYYSPFTSSSLHAHTSA